MLELNEELLTYNERSRFEPNKWFKSLASLTGTG